MKLKEYFKARSVFKKNSAVTAKNRLQIIIAQQRLTNNSPNYLPLLRQEIMTVITKYTKVETDQIKIDLQHDKDQSILELNVSLPKENTSLKKN